MGPIEIAELTLSHAMWRVETSAQNLANVITPGFKAHRTFSLDPKLQNENLAALGASPVNRQTAIDFAKGKLQQTGSRFDFAVAGDGFFVVRSDEGVFFTRNGQFHRDAEGRLATAGGLLVQSASGDVNADGDFSVLPDGTVLQGNEPVARLRVVDFDDLKTLAPLGEGLFQAPNGEAHDLENAQIRQGMLEASNVATADEMLTIMAALRSAESSQRMVQVYDDLMGKVLTTFGQ